MRNDKAVLLALMAVAFGCNEPTAVEEVARTPGEFIAVTAGGYHACAVDTIGRAWCWGSNQAGEVGVSLGLCRECGGLPRPVQTTLRFTAITAGTNHTCALATDKRAWCWGDDYYSALGSGQANICGASDGRLCAAIPVLVGGGHTFKSIVAGAVGTCGLTESGVAKCWGYQGFTANFLLTTPVTVRLASTGDSVWSSIGHTDAGLTGCGVTPANIAACWGPNFLGQLGLGTISETRAAPLAVKLAETVQSVSTGSGFACALSTANEAWCWGYDIAAAAGLGVGFTGSVPCQTSGGGVCYPTPQKVVGGRHFSSLSVGWQHVCGIDATSGESWCWGENAYGALGSTLTTGHVSPFPVRAVDGLKFTSVSAGYHFSCGLMADRSAWCWGVNNQGQLALTDGTTSSIKAVRLTLPAYQMHQ